MDVFAMVLQKTLQMSTWAGNVLLFYYFSTAADRLGLTFQRRRHLLLQRASLSMIWTHLLTICFAIKDTRAYLESLFTTYNGSSSDKINTKLYNKNTKINLTRT